MVAVEEEDGHGDSNEDPAVGDFVSHGDIIEDVSLLKLKRLYYPAREVDTQQHCDHLSARLNALLEVLFAAPTKTVLDEVGLQNHLHQLQHIQRQSTHQQVLVH